MIHYIIVKFNKDFNLKQSLKSIISLFNKALEIEGVDKVEIFTSCINLENRHDLMIKMHVTNE